MRIGFNLAGLLLIAFLASPGRSSAQGPTSTPNPSARISSPSAGSGLFGVVTISGTATDPAMQNYRLEYLLQGDVSGQWQPIGKPIAQQVANAVLGQWDTSQLVEGTYQLRLRVTLRNGTVLEDVVNDLKVSNRLPTALPTVPPPPTATHPPTAGPSPSPLIQQPPTATERTGVSNALPAAPVGPAGGLPIDFLPGAVCGGMFIALIGFLALGGYAVIRARIRQTPLNRNG